MNRIFRLLLIFFCFFSHNKVLSSDLTWERLKEKKNGVIDIYYQNSDPFLINENGKMSGFEYEMLIGFKHFILDKYGYELNYNWLVKNSFKDVYNSISENSDLGRFGINIISYTEERSQNVKLSSPYFPDTQVLISNKSTPTVKSMNEFIKVFNNYTAFSVMQTTYDANLKKIKKQYKMDFKITYMNSSDEILNKIINTPNSFGYTDLLNYLSALKKNKLLKRQIILSERGHGYCILFNKNSKWGIPINQYLLSPEFDSLRQKTIQKHLGYDINQFIKSSSERENEKIILLQKEKKFINHELFQKERQVQQDIFIRNMLIFGLVLLIIIAYAFFYSNKSKAKANEILMIHREKIEDQNALLSKHNQELVLRDEEKNNFIHILSHDLRSPINNISGLTGILKMDEKSMTVDQLRMINHIANESQRLNKMVTRILDIEKIESKTPEEFSKIKLNQILERVIENYNSQAKNKNIEIEKNIDEHIVVLGDEQYLFHVFENLVSNSIKFSPPNKKVYIEAKSFDFLAKIRITDEGPGMTEEDQQNMFKKFQVLSAKATAGERSTGLGLSIVNKYIGLLGGELECESEPGKGTTFIVKLSLDDK